MATTKENVKERVNDVLRGFTEKNEFSGRSDFDKLVDSAISKMDLSKEEDNFTPAYIVFAAVLEKYATHVLHGSCDLQRIKRDERKKNKLKKGLSLYNY